MNRHWRQQVLTPCYGSYVESGELPNRAGPIGQEARAATLRWLVYRLCGGDNSIFAENANILVSKSSKSGARSCVDLNRDDSFG